MYAMFVLNFQYFKSFCENTKKNLKSIALIIIFDTMKFNK